MRSPAPDAVATAGLGLGLLLLAIGGRGLLEAQLVTHLLVQMPILLAAGALLALVLPAGRLDPWNRGGATGLLLAASILAFWMLPRAIDASLADGRYELGKLASLPLAGAALAWSLPRLPELGRAILLAHLLAMTGALGWVYLAAPTRLCLRYRESEQATLGMALLLLALAGLLAVLAHALLGRPGIEPGDRSGGGHDKAPMMHAGSLDHPARPAAAGVDPRWTTPAPLLGSARRRPQRAVAQRRWATRPTCSSPSSPTTRCGS